MSERVDLEAEVIEELEQGNRISAIKILRAKRSIGLKHAKDLIESYLNQNPYLVTEHPKSSFNFILLLAIPFLAYVLYRIFSPSQ